jgi:hypothetical protein
MERNAELAVYLTRMYDVFNTGEVAIVDDLVSREQGILGVGTDPGEWWFDDAFRDAFRAQAPQVHAAGMRLEPGALQAFSEGSVGWFADQPTLKMAAGGAVPMRLTGVCHQEDGAWKVVQFHLSIGVPDEEALGVDLTI